MKGGKGVMHYADVLNREFYWILTGFSLNAFYVPRAFQKFPKAEMGELEALVHKLPANEKGPELDATRVQRV
jgi:hypothetical protein